MDSTQRSSERVMGMPKYLWEVNYTSDGVRGVMKEGGTSRVETIDKLIANMGGSLECFYFAFGDCDGYLIADMPENSDVAAVAMTVGAAGAATVKTTVLLTPEEIDTASKKSVDYRPPGK
jgi:uncharacterized protein with GYD domain